MTDAPTLVPSAMKSRAYWLVSDPTPTMSRFWGTGSAEAEVAPATPSAAASRTAATAVPFVRFMELPLEDVCMSEMSRQDRRSRRGKNCPGLAGERGTAYDGPQDCEQDAGSDD